MPDIYLLPHWDDDLDNFVTTYRCGKCAPISFRETRDKLLGTTSRREIDSCAEFFHRYKILVNEHIRGARIDAVRAALLELVERLRTRDLVIEIDTKNAIKLEDLPKPDMN